MESVQVVNKPPSLITLDKLTLIKGDNIAFPFSIEKTSLKSNTKISSLTIEKLPQSKIEPKITSPPVEKSTSPKEDDKTESLTIEKINPPKSKSPLLSSNPALENQSPSTSPSKSPEKIYVLKIQTNPEISTSAVVSTLTTIGEKSDNSAELFNPNVDENSCTIPANKTVHTSNTETLTKSSSDGESLEKSSETTTKESPTMQESQIHKKNDEKLSPTISEANIQPLPSKESQESSHSVKATNDGRLSEKPSHEMSLDKQLSLVTPTSIKSPERSKNVKFFIKRSKDKSFQSVRVEKTDSKTTEDDSVLKSVDTTEDGESIQSTNLFEDITPETLKEEEEISAASPSPSMNIILNNPNEKCQSSTLMKAVEKNNLKTYKKVHTHREKSSIIGVVKFTAANEKTLMSPKPSTSVSQEDIPLNLLLSEKKISTRSEKTPTSTSESKISSSKDEQEEIDKCTKSKEISEKSTRAKSSADSDNELNISSQNLETKKSKSTKRKPSQSKIKRPYSKSPEPKPKLRVRFVEETTYKDDENTKTGRKARRPLILSSGPSSSQKKQEKIPFSKRMEKGMKMDKIKEKDSQPSTSKADDQNPPLFKMVKKEVYVCPKCSEVNDEYNAHYRHLKYECKKQYACTSCPRTFIEESHLRMHERIHKGSMMDAPGTFLCDNCQKSFQFKSSLINHISFLCGREFECAICLMRFKTSELLGLHMNSYHPFQLENKDSESNNKKAKLD